MAGFILSVSKTIQGSCQIQMKHWRTALGPILVLGHGRVGSVDKLEDERSSSNDSVSCDVEASVSELYRIR